MIMNFIISNILPIALLLLIVGSWIMFKLVMMFDED